LKDAIMDGWWFGVWSDFSDLPSIAIVLRLGVRMLIAAVLGGMLGYDRELKGKPAGLRTHMLVSLGAAMFVIGSQPAEGDIQALSRVVQGLATGIGFLGGGAILKNYDEGNIHGLTTAAGIWMTAAIGVAAGAGKLATALLATMLALVILTVVRRLEPHNPSS
jgi:putative Mg2+ transporter-C (MgtC) family protein